MTKEEILDKIIGPNSLGILIHPEEAYDAMLAYADQENAILRAESQAKDTRIKELWTDEDMCNARQDGWNDSYLYHMQKGRPKDNEQFLTAYKKQLTK